MEDGGWKIEDGRLRMAKREFKIKNEKLKKKTLKFEI